MSKTSKKGVFSKIMRYIGRYKYLLALSVLFAAVSAVLTLLVPVLIGDAIDLIVSKGRVDFAGIGSILLKIGVVISVTAILQWLMNIFNNRITFNVVLLNASLRMSRTTLNVIRLLKIFISH